MATAWRGRILGLDVVRAVAIILVFVAHGLLFYTPDHARQLVAPVLGATATLGVEIFFVLSGFLIGRIIIKDILETGAGWRALRRFYVRRWLRTLPLYYLVLVSLGVPGGRAAWKYLVFVQNFDEKALQAFGVSWSLAIEEWFYLLIPLTLLLLCRGGAKRRAFFAVCAAVIVASVVARIYAVMAFNAAFDYGIRKQIPLRMDGVVFGVTLAGLREWRSGVYHMLATSKVCQWGSAIGFLLCGVFFFLPWSGGCSFFARTFFLSFVSLCCAGLIAWLESSDAVNTRARNGIGPRAITFVSVTSYAAYLVHPQIYTRFAALNPTLVQLMTRMPAIGILAAFAQWVAATACTLGMSYLLHKRYEAPAMRLRERLFI